jgi:nitrilase
VIDPWGKIVGELEDQPGVLIADIDLEQATKVRAMLPSLQHDRDFGLATFP